MDQELWWRFLEAERGSHENHDGLVSPEQVLSAQTDKKVGDRRKGEGVIGVLPTCSGEAEMRKSSIGGSEKMVSDHGVNGSRTAAPLRAATAWCGIIARGSRVGRRRVGAEGR